MSKHDPFDKLGRLAAGFGALAVLTVLLNLAILAGAIYVVVLVLRATGVIA